MWSDVKYLPGLPSYMSLAVSVCIRHSTMLCVIQAQTLLLELQGALLKSDEDGVDDTARAQVFAALAAADKALADGADEQLQLLSVASTMQKALCV